MQFPQPLRPFSRVLVIALLAIEGAGAQERLANAGPLVLNAERLRLGVAGAPEWESFENDPPSAPRLDLKFESRSNPSEATLFIRQDEVRQDWGVELNGQRLGKLFTMEADLRHMLAIPPGVLRDGENKLSILPLSKIADDIVVHEIRIEPRPLSEVLRAARLAVTVSDEATNGPLPCRVTILDSTGALAALASPHEAPQQALRPGVIYTGNGRASCELLPGNYTIYASRGFEWSVAEHHVDVTAGVPAEVVLALRREVPTPGLVSCDTHIHTLTHSGHGDSTLDERILTLAGEGIELPIATDHNVCIDYVEPAKRMGVTAYFTPVTGSEITTNAGHFNIFPIRAETPVPFYRLTDWPRLMTAIRGTPGVRVVVLNHPRNIHNNFQPFALANFDAVTGENKRGPEFTFDAMELLNSSAQQSDYMLVFRDWFALLNHGYRVTAVGSSDSHDVSRYIVGQGRTYIACPDDDPSRLDVQTACSNLLKGRALVSMGLLVNMKVEDKFSCGDVATPKGDEVRVHIEVFGPSWTNASKVMLFANGEILREEPIPESAGRHAGLKAAIDWAFPRPSHDVHLIALATGPAVTASYWAIPKPYQPTSRQWTGRVIASTNPIWLDADRDGTFTAAREYGRKVVQAEGIDASRLLPALAGYDEAFAIQAASLCASAGARLDSEDYANRLKTAAPQVQRGFLKYLETRP